MENKELHNTEVVTSEEVKVEDTRDTMEEFKRIVKEAVAEELKAAIPDINSRVATAINEELKKKVIITKKAEQKEEDANLKYVNDTFNRIKGNLFK